MKISIRNKIAFLVAFLISASILLTGLPLYSRMVDALIVEEEKSIRHLSETQSQQIINYMHTLYQDMGVIQDNYEYSIAKNKNDYSLAVNSINSLMLANKHYHAIKIFSIKPPYKQQLSLISDEYDLPIEEYDQYAEGNMLKQLQVGMAMKNSSAISSLTRNEGRLDSEEIETSVYGLQKLYDAQSQLAAILIIEVPFKQLLDQIHDTKDKYDYYYTNQNGEVLFTTEPETKNTLALQQIIYAEMLFPWVSGLISGDNDQALDQLFFDQVDNDKRASHLVKINYDHLDSGQYIGQIITIPYKELIRSAISSRNWLLFFVVIMIVLGMVVSYLFSRHISKPIEILSDSVRNGDIGNNFAVNKIEQRHDELGLLAGSLKDYVSFFNLQSNEIRRHESQLEAVLNNIMECVLVISDKGIIEEVNNSTLQTFGYRYEEMIGEPIEMIMPEEYREHHQSFLDRYINSGEAAVLGTIRNITAQKKDGSEFNIELGVNEVILPDKHLFTGVIRDVSVQVEYEKHLLEAKRTAEETSLAKSHFLSMMSHEIRTPMNGVLGVMQLLREEKSALSSDQFRFVETAYSSARSLLDILNGILDLSKIESGRLELENSELNIFEQLEDITRLYYQSARDKGIELGLIIDPEVPRYIIADQLKLRQILGNLINNAIKFTDHGGVYIYLYAKSIENDQAQMSYCFVVQDTGIGLNVENQQRIFEPFIQAEVDITRRFGGTGLGLSIVHKLVEIFGGEIKLDSQQGEGSRFEVCLPFTRTDREQSILKISKQKRFLLIYDNIFVREILQKQLQLLGTKVEAFTQDEFDRFTPGHQYDYVIVEGFKILQNLHARLDGDDSFVEIILISNNESQAKSQTLNVDKVILQPIQFSDLSSLIDVDAEPHEKPDINQRYAVSNEVNKMMSDKKILLVEDNQVNQMVATSILKKIGYNATVAANGQEAVDMLQADSYDLVLMDCHMPLMDGYEATKAIRELQGEIANVPIVAMTADAAMSDRERCLSVGMNDHLPKPIDMAALKAMVEQWIL